MESKENVKSDIMNLIGYGLAKFDKNFIKEFSMPSKAAFARYVVQLGLAETEKAVSNRMDSFDPYFDNGRRGWFQRNQREHIKLYIDSLFGNEDVHSYANIVKLFMKDFNSNIAISTDIISPTQKSRFKQLQETGKEAEFYFMNNFNEIPIFKNGIIEDARLWGDGYDFQIQCKDIYLLAEVKGLRTGRGSVRMTQNEYNKALEYNNDYILVVVSNLQNIPRINYIENPVQTLSLTPKEISTTQINYYSDNLNW